MGAGGAREDDLGMGLPTLQHPAPRQAQMHAGLGSVNGSSAAGSRGRAGGSNASRGTAGSGGGGGAHRDRPRESNTTSARSISPHDWNASLSCCHVQSQGKLWTTTWGEEQGASGGRWGEW